MMVAEAFEQSEEGCEGGIGGGVGFEQFGKVVQEVSECGFSVA